MAIVLKSNNKFDTVFNDFFSIALENGFPKYVQNDTGFPFYDVYEDENKSLIVELALAGYNKDDIKVIVENGHLLVECEAAEIPTGRNYIHMSLTRKYFKKVWAIPGKYTDLPIVKMIDGILTIIFSIDESKKPKQITIG